MEYSSKNWWTELALFVAVSAASVVLLSLLLAAVVDGDNQSVSGLLVIIPSVVLGLVSARIYRRRHTPTSTD
ncbi:hypothetical protein [Streptomyces lavendofoliae]|uniref:hypothetical protein n=1 Tax=Streptomyces lavendofoliae TaxID=67314 RepID=UPI003D8BE9E9